MKKLFSPLRFFLSLILLVHIYNVNTHQESKSLIQDNSHIIEVSEELMMMRKIDWTRLRYCPERKTEKDDKAAIK